MLVGILRTILIIIVVYYLIKLMVWLFSYVSDKKTYSDKNQEQSYSKRKEGETIINYIPKEKKTIKEDSGEYIDYEEVDED
jgi:hypothetical protein